MPPRLQVGVVGAVGVVVAVWRDVAAAPVPLAAVVPLVVAAVALVAFLDPVEPGAADAPTPFRRHAPEDPDRPQGQ